jgi:ribosomal protein S1
MSEGITLGETETKGEMKGTTLGETEVKGEMEGTTLGGATSESTDSLIFNTEETLNSNKGQGSNVKEMLATKLGDISELDQSLIVQSEQQNAETAATLDRGGSENDADSDFESKSEFQQEMEKPLADYSDGDLIKGIVRSVEKSGVLVDINYKSDGYIANSDLSFDSNFNAREDLAPGDEIAVVIEKLETKEGYTILSRKRAEVIEIWENIVEASKKRESIDVDVTSQVQGGLVIAYKGVKGFVPASQVMMADDESSLEQFVNQSLSVVPIQVDRRRRKFICSHKQSCRSTRRELNSKLFDELEVGSVCPGKVTSIKEFGVFVDIGGMEGLVHISEMSWSRVVTPSELVSIGDNIDVFVLGVDKENCRISLGMKQLQQDPWVTVNKKFKIGQIVTGTIVRIVPFGAFIRIEELVEGLIHISELSFEHVKSVSDVVTVGQEIEAKVIKLIPEEQKIGLTLKGLKDDDSPKDDAVTDSIKEEKSVEVEAPKLQDISFIKDEIVAESEPVSEEESVTEEKPLEVESIVTTDKDG